MEKENSFNSVFSGFVNGVQRGINELASEANHKKSEPVNSTDFIRRLSDLENQVQGLESRLDQMSEALGLVQKDVMQLENNTED